MATAKRFTLKGLIEGVPNICDNDEIIEQEEAVILLNALHEENQALKTDRARYEEECRLDVFKELSEENSELRRHLDVMRSGALTDDKRIKELYEENEQLKQREENLLSEIDDFQQLLTKNDNICYKRVIDLIDVRIKNGEEAIEWGKSMDADYSAMGFHVEMLKLLKKELEE